MKKRYLFKNVLDIIADLVYPKRCVVCQKQISVIGEIALCSKCRAELPHPKVVRDDGRYFDEAIAMIPYEGHARDAMIKYKFKSAKYYYKAYAYLISRALDEREYLKDALICPVPISKTRDREYSQTRLIADELARIWGCDCRHDLMYRCRVVGQISKMKLYERKFYISGSIDVNPRYDIYGKDILVVDDIFTSGTTADECAKVLKTYGAKHVYVLCPCYD